MKRLLIACSLWLCLVPALFAGTTTVSGTITDPNGQAFANGSVTATFRPSPDRPTDTYTSGGATFSQTITATLNGSGAFAGMVLTDSLTVNPGNSSWIFTVCSNTSAPCFQYTAPAGSITGGALSLTGVLTAAAPVIKIQPNVNIVQFAYSDAEINGPIIGSVYYNTLTGNARIYNGAIWANIATSITACATINNLCKSDGAGAFVNSSVVDGTNLVTTKFFQVPDSTGSSVPSIFGTNSATGLYLNGVVVGLVSAASGWVNVGNIAASGVQAPLSGSFCFSSSNTLAAAACDTFTGRLGAQSYIIGRSAAQATPLTYNFQVGENASGANIAGVNGVIRAGNGTGSGGGGSLIFQTGLPHGSDSVADTFTTGLTIDKNQLVSAPVSFTSPHVAATTDLTIAGGVAQTGTQGSTGTKLFSCTGAFVSGNFVKTDANGNCVDGGATSSAITKEFATVTAASSSGTAATTYFLNGQTVAAAEFVQGAKFVIESTSKWINNDSGLTKTASFGVGIDGTNRGSCSATAIAASGGVGFGFDRLTMTVMTTGAGGTMLISNECASSTASSEVSSVTTIALDTTTTHTFTSAVVAPAVDTSSTGTSLILTGYRFF